MIPHNSNPSVEEIQNWLIVQVAEMLELDAKQVDPKMNLVELGVSSVQLATLAGDLESWAGNFVVSHETIVQAKTLEEFAELVQKEKIGQ